MYAVEVRKKMEETIRPNPANWLDEHGDYLYRFAMFRVRQESVAEDLVQETLLAGLQAFEKFEGRGLERTWLCGILKHKIIDHFRKASRTEQIDPEAEERLENEDLYRPRSDKWADHWKADTGPMEWNDSPEALLEQSEFRVVLEKCVAFLPERIANAFVLREVEGFKSEEICEILNVSANNLWVMLHRARMQLRRCIETDWFRLSK